LVQSKKPGISFLGANNLAVVAQPEHELLWSDPGRRLTHQNWHRHANSDRCQHIHRGTTIADGQLLVDNTTGSGLGTGSVQVNAGRLGGNGTIAGAVTVGTGTGAAQHWHRKRCDDLGTITIQSTLTFNSNARYNCELKD